MSTIETLLLGTAERMSGMPRTESGEGMPLAAWYQLTALDDTRRFVAVTNHGLYESNSMGQIHDFFACLYERRAVDTHADALAHIGYQLNEAK